VFAGDISARQPTPEPPTSGGRSVHAVDRARALESIRAFIEASHPELRLDQLEQLRASDVIRQSVELVEFVLHLEDSLGIEIDIGSIGENLITDTFAQLADRLVAIAENRR
jgi:acyl carrier protein